MKKSILFILGLLTGVLIMVILCYTNVCHLGCCKKEEHASSPKPILPDEGIIITADEFRSMTDSFMAHNPERLNAAGYWGGKIGRTALQTLIDSLKPGEQFVNYKFGLSNFGQMYKTYLMFASRKKISTGDSAYLYLMSGSGSTVFCPPTCIPKPAPNPQ